MIDFFVPGSPVPGGSKRAFPRQGADGKLHVAVADTSGPKGREWRAAIRFAAADAADAVLEGPLRVAFWFCLLRPRGHMGKRGILPSAPPYPARKPDVLKLARAVEDACTGIVWRDDAQIVEEELYKLYADGDRRPGVRICVIPLPEERGEHAELPFLYEMRARHA